MQYTEDDLRTILRNRGSVGLVGVVGVLLSASQVFRGLEFALARIFAMNSYEPARNFERTPVSLRASSSAPKLELEIANLSAGGMQVRSKGPLDDALRTGLGVKVEVEIAQGRRTVDTIRIVAYFSNLVLISAFFGLGIGALSARFAIRLREEGPMHTAAAAAESRELSQVGEKAICIDLHAPSQKGSFILRWIRSFSQMGRLINRSC